MKQHITNEQLNKLDDKAKEKLRNWWKPIEGDWILHDHPDEGGMVGFEYLPLLSIGQMIKFILDAKMESREQGTNYFGNNYIELFFENKEIVDVLWNQVKYILNNK